MCKNMNPTKLFFSCFLPLLILDPVNFLFFITMLESFLSSDERVKFLVFTEAHTDLFVLPILLVN
jgi:hypothetical protein